VYPFQIIFSSYNHSYEPKPSHSNMSIPGITTVDTTTTAAATTTPATTHIATTTATATTTTTTTTTIATNNSFFNISTNTGNLFKYFFDSHDYLYST